MSDNSNNDSKENEKITTGSNSSKASNSSKVFKKRKSIRKTVNKAKSNKFKLKEAAKEISNKKTKEIVLGSLKSIAKIPTGFSKKLIAEIKTQAEKTDFFDQMDNKIRSLDIEKFAKVGIKGVKLLTIGLITAGAGLPVVITIDASGKVFAIAYKSYQKGKADKSEMELKENFKEENLEEEGVEGIGFENIADFSENFATRAREEGWGKVEEKDIRESIFTVLTCRTSEVLSKMDKAAKDMFSARKHLKEYEKGTSSDRKTLTESGKKKIAEKLQEACESMNENIKLHKQITEARDIMKAYDENRFKKSCYRKLLADINQLELSNKEGEGIEIKESSEEGEGIKIKEIKKEICSLLEKGIIDLEEEKKLLKKIASYIEEKKNLLLKNDVSLFGAFVQKLGFFSEDDSLAVLLLVMPVLCVLSSGKMTNKAKASFVNYTFSFVVSALMKEITDTSNYFAEFFVADIAEKIARKAAYTLIAERDEKGFKKIAAKQLSDKAMVGGMSSEQKDIKGEDIEELDYINNMKREAKKAAKKISKIQEALTNKITELETLVKQEPETYTEKKSTAKKIKAGMTKGFQEIMAGKNVMQMQNENSISAAAATTAHSEKIENLISEIKEEEEELRKQRYKIEVYDRYLKKINNKIAQKIANDQSMLNIVSQQFVDKMDGGKRDMETINTSDNADNVKNKKEDQVDDFEKISDDPVNWLEIIAKKRDEAIQNWKEDTAFEEKVPQKDIYNEKDENKTIEPSIEEPSIESVNELPEESKASSISNHWNNVFEIKDYSLKPNRPGNFSNKRTWSAKEYANAIVIKIHDKEENEKKDFLYKLIQIELLRVESHEELYRLIDFYKDVAANYFVKCGDKQGAIVILEILGKHAAYAREEDKRTPLFSPFTEIITNINNLQGNIREIQDEKKSETEGKSKTNKYISNLHKDNDVVNASYNIDKTLNPSGDDRGDLNYLIEESEEKRDEIIEGNIKNIFAEYGRAGAAKDVVTTGAAVVMDKLKKQAQKVKKKLTKNKDSYKFKNEESSKPLRFSEKLTGKTVVAASNDDLVLAEANKTAKYIKFLYGENFNREKHKVNKDKVKLSTLLRAELSSASSLDEFMQKLEFYRLVAGFLVELGSDSLAINIVGELKDYVEYAREAIDKQTAIVGDSYISNPNHFYEMDKKIDNMNELLTTTLDKNKFSGKRNNSKMSAYNREKETIESAAKEFAKKHKDVIDNSSSQKSKHFLDALCLQAINADDYTEYLRTVEIKKRLDTYITNKKVSSELEHETKLEDNFCNKIINNIQLDILNATNADAVKKKIQMYTMVAKKLEGYYSHTSMETGTKSITLEKLQEEMLSYLTNVDAAINERSNKFKIKSRRKKLDTDELSLYEINKIHKQLQYVENVYEDNKDNYLEQISNDFKDQKISTYTTNSFRLLGSKKGSQSRLAGEWAKVIGSKQNTDEGKKNMEAYSRAMEEYNNDENKKFIHLELLSMEQTKDIVDRIQFFKGVVSFIKNNPELSQAILGGLNFAVESLYKAGKISEDKKEELGVLLNQKDKSSPEYNMHEKRKEDDEFLVDVVRSRIGAKLEEWQNKFGNSEIDEIIKNKWKDKINVIEKQKRTLKDKFKSKIKKIKH